MEYTPLQRFVCVDCDKSYKKNCDLQRHRQSVHNAVRYICIICSASMSRRDALLRHIHHMHNVAHPQSFLAPTTTPQNIQQPKHQSYAVALPSSTIQPTSDPKPSSALVLDSSTPHTSTCRVPTQELAPFVRPSVIMRAPPRAPALVETVTADSNESSAAQVPSSSSAAMSLETSSPPQPPCIAATPQPSIRTVEPNPTFRASSDEKVLVQDSADANDSPHMHPRTTTCTHCSKVLTTNNLSRHRRFNCPRLRSEPPVINIPTVQVGYGQRPAHVMSDDSGSEDEHCSTLPNNIAPDGFVEVETGFRGRLKTFRLRDQPTQLQTIPEFLGSMLVILIELYHHIHQHVNTFKTNLWLDCEFTNVHGDICRRTFKTKNIPLYRSTDTEQVCREMFEKLNSEYETCAMKGSGWTFLRVMDMEIRINVCVPLAGASYIPIPPSIAHKHAIVNVCNDRDEKCFEYAILSRFLVNPLLPRPEQFTAELRARVNLDFTGLTFPVTVQQVGIFEKRNGVSVNVYGLDSVWNRKKNRMEHIVFPIRVCKRELHPNHFDLLLMTNEDTTHYALITDFERLVRSQITLHKGRIHVCKRCLTHFNNEPNKRGQTGEEQLEEHRLHCYENAPLRTDLAEKKEIKFERFERAQRVRFTIYADFECMLVPFEAGREAASTVRAPVGDLAEDRGASHQRDEAAGLESARVTTKTIHKPYAYAYHIMDNHRKGQDSNDTTGNTFSELRLYRGPDAAQHFMQSLKDDVQMIGDVLYGNRQLNPQLSAGEEASFQAATHCYLCKGPFESTDIKVRDHQHSTPFRYRGAAHQLCNLRFKEQDLVNCYFHNLSNYDAHFLVRELGIDKGDVSVLANTEEKFITFTKRFHYRGAGRHDMIGVRFVDSYRFMSRSLAQLVELMPSDNLHCTKANFADPEQFALVHRKGVFPYDHIASLEVLDEEVLPPPGAFRNNMQMEDVKAEDYAHAQCVWRSFNCRTLGDYSDIYLKSDVTLLTDVFESFRDNCLEHYGLDPAHYITLPSYAWDVMLFKTGVTLDTLQDIDMYMFFERGIRGGVVQCVTRHAVANNKYTRNSRGTQCDVGINDKEDEREEDDYITYLDANNLYGWAMSQPLPYGNFEWLSREEINSLNIASIGADDQVGYVLEVDLEYPQDRELQDRHKDLPFCPELRKAPTAQLPYPPEVLETTGVGKSAKLMTTLLDKVRYVIHYKLLQQALDNGLRLRHIHQVLRFNQKAWLKPYVVMNTRLRQLARSKFEQELFKLMVNAVYGMSLQNVRKHLDIKVATNIKQYNKHVSKPNFGDRTWFKENLALLHMLKIKVVLDKPVYAGMCILDHSKWWMYGFHYRMIDRYGLDRIRLLYTDTDSLIYLIRTPDVYRDMLERSEEFDTSNYPQNHPLYNLQNAKVLGKFKDETNGVALLEFIGLMSKLYCLLRCGDTDEEDGPPPIKRAKGVNNAVVKHRLTVEDYRRCLQQATVKHTVNTRFQSRHHIMYTVDVTKRSLAPYDDKRYVVPDGGGVSTLPWGHYSIPPAQ